MSEYVELRVTIGGGGERTISHLAVNLKEIVLFSGVQFVSTPLETPPQLPPLPPLCIPSLQPLLKSSDVADD